MEPAVAVVVAAAGAAAGARGAGGDAGGIAAVVVATLAVARCLQVQRLGGDRAYCGRAYLLSLTTCTSIFFLKKG